ncbi:MAG: tetratricopeptide repeat protein [Deltaproteobacteria bacterium]|nr:tetratricopeptide repeat protein [Deltaproteobacteria bacterium]
MPGSGSKDSRDQVSKALLFIKGFQRMYNNRMVYLGIALIALCGCFGCVQKTGITVIRHAEVSLQDIRTLSILKFGGMHEELVRKALYNKIIEVQNLNNKHDYIRVINIDQNSLEYFDDDINFSPDFEGVHADGVISGRVAATIKDVHDTEKVKIQEGTGEYKEGKNVFGQEAEVEIQRTVIKEVPYVMRQANIIVDFSIVNLKTKQRIFTDKVSEEYKEKFGGENEYRSYLENRMSQLPSQNQTLEELSDKVASRIAAKIFTTEITRVVEFDNGSNKYAMGMGGNKKVKEGIKCAKKGEWEKGIEIWKDVLNTEPENSAAFYNLGIAYEKIGDLENLKIAQKMYKKAVKYGDKEIYLDALYRVKATISDFSIGQQRR